MDIRNIKELKRHVLDQLARARDQKIITAIYAGSVIGMSVLVAIVNYVLGLQIDKTGGLSSMGQRTVLAAIQTMLPLVQSVIAMCVELGYVAAMLRIARGQYTSPNTLRLGFDRFWVLLRYRILEGLIFIGLGFGALYCGVTIYVMTPLSKPAMELLAPIAAQSSLLNPTIEVSEALYSQLLQTMLPAFAICGLIYLIVALPVMYRLRMGAYVIIDKPGMGALSAMRESRKMMHGHCLELFKLDLSYWWFFLAQVAATVVCYGDQLLPLLGISLPLSADAAFFLFYGLYWVLEFVIFYLLRSRMEVAYALAYDAIRPEEQSSGGVVLGNIFQM